MKKLFKIQYWNSTYKYNKDKDYYKILGLTKNATENQIKNSFHMLAKKYHPDLNKGNQQLFKEANQAYQILSDKQLRKQYDLGKSQAKQPNWEEERRKYDQNASRKQQYTHQKKENYTYQTRYSTHQYNRSYQTDQKMQQQFLKQWFKAREKFNKQFQQRYRSTFTNTQNTTKNTWRRPSYQIYNETIINMKIKQQQRIYEELQKAIKNNEDLQNKAPSYEEKILKQLNNMQKNIKNMYDKYSNKLKNVWTQINK